MCGIIGFVAKNITDKQVVLKASKQEVVTKFSMFKNGKRLRLMV